MNIPNEYYVRREGSLLVLRQTRFREQLERGYEHPHDIMAYAHDEKEMQHMINLIRGRSEQDYAESVFEDAEVRGDMEENGI